MGQKVNPNGIRLKITKEHTSNWYADKNYADMLNEDISIRKFLRKELAAGAISRIQIDRPARNAVITVHAARPGAIIGRKGEESDKLRQKVSSMMGVPVRINIQEVRKPELNARLVAMSVAQQLEKRVMFRRAMKRAISSAMRLGAEGIKIRVAGRLGGAEIARSECYREGRVPLHTFRADIDYDTAEAQTTYGVIGVKVWIFKGEVFKNKEQPVAAEATETGA